MIEINDIILEGNIAVHIVRWITVGASARAIEATASIKLAVKRNRQIPNINKRSVLRILNSTLSLLKTQAISMYN